MAENAESIAVNRGAPSGGSGTDVVARIHNADDHVGVLSTIEAAEIYDKMRRSDTQVIKVLSAISNPIKAAKWSVPPLSDDTKDIEAAALIEQILFKDLNWDKFLNECLTYIPHGFSMFEVVHMNRQNKEIGQYTGLAQLGFRRQATITEWHHNELTGELEKVKQESFSDIKINTFIQAENLLIFYNQQEGDNAGFPLCRGLYGPYKRKLLATELQYIGTERFAIPTPVLGVPDKVKSEDTEYIEAQKVLEQFTNAESSFIMKPQGWELDLHSNTFDPEKVQVLKKAENEEMVGAIVAMFLELGIGGNGGAFALGNDLSDFFLNGIEHFANGIKNPVNRCLIPHLIFQNFGDTIMPPELVYSGISDKAGKETMEIITGYKGAGIITADEQLEDHVRNIHNLPKKAEGSQVDNQTSEEGGSNESTTEEGSELERTDDDNGDNANLANGLPNDQNEPTRLADTVGHNHLYKGRRTGPAVHRGKRHFHEILDAQGNVIGRTKMSETGKPHDHEVEGEDDKTGGSLPIKFAEEPKKNPKKLINEETIRLADIIRRHLTLISEKYIADVMRNYRGLSDNGKLNATKNVKVGGKAKFQRELRATLVNTATKSLDMVRAEIPNKSDVKLSDDLGGLQADNFKFNEFSRLPRKIQLLIANRSIELSEKQANDIADVVAFQFSNSEGSTRDPEQIRQDLEDAAKNKIDSGSLDAVASNAVALAVNQSRDAFFFEPEVLDDIASFSFVNFDPKSLICKKIAGTTFSVNDMEARRLQTPLHQNCKTYIRANLKTSKNAPDITGLPSITEAERDSITLSEGT